MNFAKAILNLGILPLATLALIASSQALSQATPPQATPAQATPAQATPAQATPSQPTLKTEARPEPPPSRMPAVVKTIFLLNVTQPNDGNEILTAVRVIDTPGTKMYLTPSQNAMTIAGTQEEVALAERLIHELDRPRKTYRVAYTFTETDAGKRIGVTHSSLIVVLGGRTTLKNGSKVPVATGSYNTAGASTQTQFTYLDVGLNIDASLDALGDGVRLKSKIEQSSALEEKTIAGVNEPIVRQSVLEGTAFLAVGKPVILGSLDITGSTRRLEIEVTLEPAN